MPVGVLPRGDGYELVDPAADVRQRIDAAVAAGLETEAFILYRPLPARVLTFWDLLRASVRGQTPDILRLLAACLFSGLVALLTPVVTHRIIDTSIPSSDRVELWQVATLLIVSAVAVALVDFTRGVVLVRFRSKTAIFVQAAVWDRLLALPVSFFRRFGAADVNTRAMAVDRMQILLSADVAGALFGLFPALFSLAILFVYSWPFALLAVASASLLACATVFLSSRQLRRLRALQSVNMRLAGLACALLTGIAKLRVARAERQAFANLGGKVWGTAASR